MKIKANHGHAVASLFLEKGEVVWTVQNNEGVVFLCDSLIIFGNEEDAQTACEEGEKPKMLHIFSKEDIGYLQ